MKAFKKPFKALTRDKKAFKRLSNNLGNTFKGLEKDSKKPLKGLSKIAEKT
jgi:hypothetical protein